MRLITTLFIFFCIYSLTAQNTYQKGYFINNLGERTEALIKNLDWRSNPTEFKWKADENAQPETATMQNNKEFGFNESYRYIRYTVAFDMASNKVNSLDRNRNSNQIDHTVYLKTLVDHEQASLYLYQKGDLKKFFFKTYTMEKPEVLLNKKYLVDNKSGTTQIAQNNAFIFQLKTNVYCNKLSLQTLSYTKKDLEKYFRAYLACKNFTLANKKKDKKISVEIGLIGGLNFASFDHSIMRISGTRNAVLENSQALRVGGYLESQLPFYNNKFSIYFETSYVSFSTENKDPNSQIPAGKKLDYKSFDVLIGAKFYSYLNPNSINNKIKMYLGSGIVIPFNKSTRLEPDIITSNDDNFFNYLIPVEVGIKYKRYGLFYRYYSTTDILTGFNIRQSALKISTLTFSMAIVK